MWLPLPLPLALALALLPLLVLCSAAAEAAVLRRNYSALALRVTSSSSPPQGSASAVVARLSADSVRLDIANNAGDKQGDNDKDDSVWLDADSTLELLLLGINEKDAEVLASTRCCQFDAELNNDSPLLKIHYADETPIALSLRLPGERASFSKSSLHKVLRETTVKRIKATPIISPRNVIEDAAADAPTNDGRQTTQSQPQQQQQQQQQPQSKSQSPSERAKLNKQSSEKLKKSTDDRGFFQKYWMYILFGVFAVMLFSKPEEAPAQNQPANAAGTTAAAATAGSSSGSGPRTRRRRVAPSTS